MYTINKLGVFSLAAHVLVWCSIFTLCLLETVFLCIFLLLLMHFLSKCLFYLKQELLSKDTNPDLLETNNSSQEHDSGDDTMNDKHEQSIVDLTETDASDGMLFDGLRRIVIMF